MTPAWCVPRISTGKRQSARRSAYPGAPSAMVATASISATTPAWSAVYGRRDSLQPAFPNVRRGAPSAKTGNVSTGGALRRARSASPCHSLVASANPSRASVPASSAIRRPARRQPAAAPARSVSRGAASPTAPINARSATTVPAGNAVMGPASSVMSRPESATDATLPASDAMAPRSSVRLPVTVGSLAVRVSASSAVEAVIETFAPMEATRRVSTTPRIPRAAAPSAMIWTRTIRTAGPAITGAGPACRRSAITVSACARGSWRQGPGRSPSVAAGWSARRQIASAVMAPA